MMADDIAAPDGILQTLVSLAQTTGLSMSLTLNVSGTTVTGELVGRNSWLDLLALELPGNDGSTLGGSLQENFRTDDDDLVDYTTYGFIHLRDAKFFVGNKMAPGSGGVLWRGRLSEVSGWCFGEMVPQAPSS